MDPANPLGMRGLELIELAAHEPAPIARLLSNLGFSRTDRHREIAVDVYRQHGLVFLLNGERRSFGGDFAERHGPCVSSMAWSFDDAEAAFAEAVRRGAKPFVPTSETPATLRTPAIHGIGGSVIYFVNRFRERGGLFERTFVALDQPTRVDPKGFLAFDHLTNNVHRGELGAVAAFYKDVFGFTEVRSFDIEGEKSGLYSYALRSPCGTFCIPINEDKGTKGQIAEYLAEYRGPGVQHIAFLTDDILASLDAMNDAVPTLDIDDDYYRDVFARVPNVRESPERIRARDVLVDGDERGYLLQIFTKNVVGPIFFELIQRRNHASFGEGNFGALFRSIERDQERRGVL
ncbi:MAG: 4-hydroxyphenylpyruvate dioxygenase [Polyangiales bacterium]